MEGPEASLVHGGPEASLVHGGPEASLVHGGPEAGLVQLTGWRGRDAGGPRSGQLQEAKGPLKQPPDPRSKTASQSSEWMPAVWDQTQGDTASDASGMANCHAEDMGRLRIPWQCYESAGAIFPSAAPTGLQSVG